MWFASWTKGQVNGSGEAVCQQETSAGGTLTVSDRKVVHQEVIPDLLLALLGPCQPLTHTA